MGHPSPQSLERGRDVEPAGTARVATLDAAEDDGLVEVAGEAARSTPPQSAPSRWQQVLPLGLGLGGGSIAGLIAQPISAMALAALIAVSCTTVVLGVLGYRLRMLATRLEYQHSHARLGAAARSRARRDHRELLALAAKVRREQALLELRRVKAERRDMAGERAALHSQQVQAEEHKHQREVVRLLAAGGGEVVRADGSRLKVRSRKPTNAFMPPRSRASGPAGVVASGGSPRPLSMPPTLVRDGKRGPQG